MEKKKTAKLIIISALAIVIFGCFVLLPFLVPGQANWIDNLTLAQTVTPFWFNESNGQTTIYDEVVVPIKYGSNQTAEGYLTFTPTEIVSVKNYSGEISYTPDQYTLSGNRISFDISSGLPYIQDEWLDNKNVPAQYQDGSIIPSSYNDGGGTNNGVHVVAENALTRTNHLIVTYKYSSAENQIDFAPQLQVENYPNLMAKLTAAQPIKILIYGDSISVGASASGFVNFPPYLPTWFELIRQYLAQRYYNGDQSKITLNNYSVGGQSSSYGVEQLYKNSFDQSDYDLVIIGFGMNDASLKVNPYLFKSNTATILNQLRSSSPNADFILLGSFTANPKSAFYGLHAEYMSHLADLATTFNLINSQNKSGCTFVNLYDVSMGILSRKQANNPNDTRYQYLDISANYTNHPNDFMVRLYAGCILSTFIDF